MGILRISLFSFLRIFFNPPPLPRSFSLFFHKLPSLPLQGIFSYATLAKDNTFQKEFKMEKALIAMSGGVDSSVAAALMQEKG